MQKLLRALLAETDLYRWRGSRRITLLALAFALLGTLFIAPAGEAEAATLWTSTLNVKDLGGASRGCDDLVGATNCAQAMSDSTFELGSQTYTVKNVKVYSLDVLGSDSYWMGDEFRPDIIRTDYYLKLEVVPQIPKDVRNSLSVRIGSVDVPLDRWPVTDWRGERTGDSSSNFFWQTPAHLPWSTGDSISIKILDEPVKPMWPNKLTATRGNGAATLDWGGPVGDGNSAITRYEYRYKTTGNYPSTWTQVADGPDADTSAANERRVTVSGLTNGTEYSFELRAVNGAGNGPAWQAEATPNAPPTASDRTITVSEDNMYLFTTYDWDFNDEDEGDSLQWVMVEEYPSEEAGIIWTADDGRFPRFITRRNWNGSTYLRFRVSDGKDESKSTYTMTINVAPVNDRARGKPTISDRRQAGQTLTASTAGISDVDGLPDSFDYQWLRVDADGVSNPVAVSGATASSYTPAAADVGKRFMVRVNFADQDGHGEELTSDPTGTVQASGTINAAPTGSGGTFVTEEDTAYVFKVADFGFTDTNAGDVLVSVKVVTLPAAGVLVLDSRLVYAGEELLSSDIEASRLAFRTLPNAHGQPYSSFTYKMSDGTAETAPATITINITPVNDPARGKLKIVPDSGGRYAQASRAEIADADGMSNANADMNFVFQWSKRDPNGVVHVGGSQSSSMMTTSPQLDAAKMFMVKMTFTDDDGNTETVYSDWVLLFPASHATGAPHITAPPSLSSPGEDRVWTPGEKVEISLTFNERMTVLAYDGVPSIGLHLGGTEAKSAEYDRGNSWDTLVFSYTLTEADGSHSSMLVPPNSLALNGGIIRGREHRGDASLIHSAAAVSTRLHSNTPATGVPGIDGLPVLGQTLTATTSGIADDNGMTAAVFAYQWIRRDLATNTDTNIEGATGSTYTVTAGDEGKALKVRVTFTDDAGNEESLTSYVVGGSPALVIRDEDISNTPATGAPGIDGSPIAGQTLTATTSGIQDDDGIADAVFAYQWLADDAAIESATASTYTVVAGDAGKTIKVKVTFTDDVGNRESLTSAATAAIKQPLTAAIHKAPESHDGQNAFTFRLHFSEHFTLSYKTLRDHAFTVTGGEVRNVRRVEPGKNVRWEITVQPSDNADVTVSLPVTTDCAGQEAICTGDSRMLSNGVELVTPGPPNSAATGAPTITGTAQVSETLTVGTSGIADADGLTNASFAYRWVAGESDISGATGSSYTLTSSEQGKAIKVRVTFTDDAGHEESVTSAATATVAARPNSPATGAPTITGTAQVSETLTVGTSGIADADGLTNASFAYRWVAGESDISGATGSSYTLTSSEQGKAIRVRVTFTDDAGHEESVTSAATAAVAAAPSLLKASVHSTPASHDGSATFTFELRFSETPKASFSYVTLRDHAFTVTGGEVTNARRLEWGKNVRWEITVRPSGTADVTIVLPVTTDCASQGAVCTEDGRMLSEKVELTVSGPGG